MKTAYWNPTRYTIENGAFSGLREVLAGFHPRRILLVLGEKSFRLSPHFLKLNEMLAPYQVLESSAVSQNPTQEFVQQEINRLKAEIYDTVLAIGGGSVLDVSKLLALIPRQKDTDLANYLEGRFDLQKEPANLIAVPTTAGTGSEVSPFSSLETRDRKKFSIAHAWLYPKAAIIDPELSYSMPAYVTASTGFDALSQAIESFWSVQATPASQTHSLRALELIVPALERAVLSPRDAEARFAMAHGSCEAGLGIAQAKTTAVHSVSYPITAHFGVAHGHACALTLPSFVRFNAPVLKDRGVPLLKRFQVDDYETMASRIEKLMQAAGLERSLSKLGINTEGEALIVRDGFRPDRIKNNPRPITAEELSVMLSALR